MLVTTLYFLLALFILVIVHEYGHFQVARWCGVKVLRFSFGFGPVLARFKDKRGCEYAWSLFPLGGYVKMLGETEIPAELDAKTRSMAFSQKSLPVRIAIVLAGPLFNFLFAFVALWLVLVIGMHSLAPMIQTIKPNSLASQAGFVPNQEIIAINDTPVTSWQSFQYLMMPYIGSSQRVNFTLKSLEDGQIKHIALPLKNWNLNDKKPDLLQSLGIEPFIPKIPPIVGEVLPDSPAAKTSLQKGDVLLKVNGQPIKDWLFLVDYLKTRPDTPLTLEIQRGNSRESVNLVTGHQKNQGETQGYLGVKSQKLNWPNNWLRLEKKGPFEALGTALNQTLHLTGTTIRLMGRLVTGQLGLKTISGPLGIAQGAGDSGRNGLVSYLFFLALVSVSLGVLNLLPIPLLDGGHLLYYVLEFIKGKPLSDSVKSLGVYIGLLLLATLMVIALGNDISRLM